MSDEVEKEVTSEEVPESSEEGQVVSEAQVEDPDYSAEELAKAQANGYNPDDEKGLSPGEFNRNGSFIKKIDKQNRAIKNLKYTVHELKAQMVEAQRRGYEEGLRALEAQRKEAVRYGNEEEFNRLDTEVNQMKTNMANLAPEVPPEQQEFIERNKDWFFADSAKGKVIHDKVTEFVSGLPAHMSPDDKMRQIEEYIELAFPNRSNSTVAKKETVQPKPKPVPTVASGSPGLKSSQGKYTIDDLDEHGKIAFSRIRNNDPKFTVDEYVALLQRGNKYV